MSKNKSKIILEVELNDEKIPVDIKWNASTKDGQESCKAFMLSIFERKSKETLKIDLWTKDMQVMEMDRFFFQTFKSMTEKASRKLSLPAPPVSPRQPLKKTSTTPSKEYKGDIG